MLNDKIVEVNNLDFTYLKAKTPAIKGLHFHIAPGEIFGFLGPSGSGKSTTQKILIRLLRDYQGAVTIFGKNLKDWNADYYERIGVSFEFPNHYLKLTANENLAYFSALYSGERQTPQALLEMFALGEDSDLPVSQYSKGMKVRLSVARSLLHNPELIFWDEPTAGLDPVNARRIKDIAREQKQAGKTIFLTTHDMAVADALCDRVALIVDGEIKLIDAPHELKLKYGKKQVRIEYEKNGQTDFKDFALHDLGENAAFLTILRENNVRTIHTLEATLEDIFIDVTGRSLV